MRSTTIWTVAVALLGATASATSTANIGLPAHECGSIYESQNYPPGAPDTGNYYHLAPHLIDDATVEQVRDFTDELNGRWHGTSLHTRCILAPDDLRTTITSFDVDAEIDKHFLGALIMKLQQENSDEVVFDKIFLSPETELDESLDYTIDAELPGKTHGQRTGNRTFRIDFTSPNTLVYNQKYRRIVRDTAMVHPGMVAQQHPRVSEITMRVVHEIKTISFNDSKLTVNRDVYVDRRFVSQQQWQLERI